ncbi:NRDE family protein [Dokdonella sp. MW10]|uniref:NRDE family protein n=1 Tax=Dokdonella sp. MW10 TaxID=2992926 RepID=UPI003F7D73B8
MCILLVAIDHVRGWPLVLLGNRDEFHARASTDAAPWREAPDCLGGRDLVAGGAWLGVRNDGAFAAVTNLRSGVPARAPRSRGALVRDFLLGSADAREASDAALAGRDEYGGFNLVLGDARGTWLVDGVRGTSRRLGSGVHVVSNGATDVHWPKMERLRDRFTGATAHGGRDEDRLLGLLHDTFQPDDARLPDTGVGLVLERTLAPVFIEGEHYGTRAATLVMRDPDRRLLLRERSFGPGGTRTGEVAWECANAEAEWHEA